MLLSPAPPEASESRLLKRVLITGLRLPLPTFLQMKRHVRWKRSLRHKEGVAVGFKSDASNFEQAHVLVDQVVAQFGTVDVLVNNAGITRDTLMMRMSEEQWDEVINTNLKSAFNLTKAVIKPMLKAR